MAKASKVKRISFLFFLLISHFAALAALPEAARCIAPAKPGGGFDLTCQLLSASLVSSGVLTKPLPIAYLPGGIGALAFRQVVTQKPADSGAVVAFSSGSLLNLAQGRFGSHSTSDVRWLVSLGLDHGIVAVRQDASFKNLPELIKKLRDSPNSVVFGAGGSIGSQDWMKAALLAKAAGVSHKVMRFVAYEGGGEAFTALQGNYVQVITGDAAEVARLMDSGAKIKVLAVLAEHRLPGRWAQIPTAREQGFDIRWPIIRGLYMSKDSTQREQRDWIDAIRQATSSEAFSHELSRFGLLPEWRTGAALDQLVEQQIMEYRKLVIDFGLTR